MQPSFRTTGSLGLAGVTMVVAATIAACSDGVTPPDGNGTDSAPASVSVTGEASVDIGGTLQLSAAAETAAGQSVTAPITWSSSNSDLATVDATGLVTGVARGTATITASTPGAAGTIQDMHDVVVTVAAVTVTPSLDTLTSIGDTLVLVTAAQDALGNPVPGVAVPLTATNPGTVSLIGGDTVVAVGSGTAEVTASLDGRAASATVVVRQVAVTFSMPVSVDTLTSFGDTQTYTVTAADARGNAVTDGFTWSSTTPAVASISGSSNAVNATAVGNGSTTIRAVRDGQQAEATLVVDQQVVQVAVTPGSASVVEGFTEQLSAEAQDARGNAVASVTSFTWATSDVGVATVDGTGLVTGQAQGAATITATGGGGSGSAEITVAAVSFSQHVQPVFTNNCALSGCHAGSSPAQGMNLSAGQAYGNIVNVPSNESSLFRIKPSEPDLSYLIHKIQGTQGSVGGSGSQMPLGGTALSQETIDMLRAWVAKGAPNN